jgi:hypothetical protein
MPTTRKNLSVVPARGASAASPMSALPLLEVATSVTSWLTTISTERTRREQIAAQRDAVLAVVEARRSLAELAIRLAMQERVQVLDGLLGSLDQAIAAQDVGSAAAVLQQVGALASSPPFSSAAELLTAWDAPDATIVL